MKRIVILMAILGLVGAFAACGGSDVEDIPGPKVTDTPDCNHVGEEIILQSASVGEPPDWAFGERPWRGVDDNTGEPVMFFYSEGRSKQKNLAERSARGGSAAAAAESVHKKVLSQFAEAVESWGSEEDEEIEQVRMSLVAYKAKVKVVGQYDAGGYAYQVEKVKALQGDGCTADHTQSANLWVYVLRQAINYSDYQRMRNEALGEAVGSTNGPNEKQQEMLNRAEEAMASLDDFY